MLNTTVMRTARIQGLTIMGAIAAIIVIGLAFGSAGTAKADDAGAVSPPVTQKAQTDQVGETDRAAGLVAVHQESYPGVPVEATISDGYTDQLGQTRVVRVSVPATELGTSSVVMVFATTTDGFAGMDGAAGPAIVAGSPIQPVGVDGTDGFID